MKRLLLAARRYWVNFLKYAGDAVDVFKPKGHVEVRLYIASGPRQGELHSVHRGRNIVTSWLSVNGASPTSGRDMMRRLLIPTGFPGELSSSADAVVGKVELGSGTSAESVSDTALELPLLTLGVPSSIKNLTSVELDPLNPYVKFIFDYAEAEANGTISEAALYSNRDPGDGRGDFIARKTFGSFTKTSDFTMQIRWQIRF